MSLAFKSEILLCHLTNLLADGEGCRGARRWCVEDVNAFAALFDDKIVHQRAAGGYGLRAHAGAAGNEIALADFRQQLLQRAHKSRLAERAVELTKTGLPIFARDRPKTLE